MTNDVNKFINDFKDSKISKIEIFEAFEYDVFTLEEQKYIFDNLKTKQKCQLYNTISVEARNKYCEYLDALEPVINDKGKKVVYFDEFMSSIRSQAVKDAKIMEQQLLDNGMCTRDWSIEQIKELYTFNESGALSTIPGTPKEYYEFGNPRYNVNIDKDGDVSVTQYSIEGHHMKNVSENNALAGDWRNIQFLERSGEHFDAHAKNFSNQTIAFYDGKNYVGVTYKAPRVENGVYIEGGYEANGKAYRFDDSEDVKKFVEITPSDSNYSQIMNEIQEY